jgi:pyruvate formate lyase activating enzyme
LMLNGIVFNIQRYSIDDGPGIRSTIFLKGCPLTCLWCSNPESQKPNPEISHSDVLCNKCGKCLELCNAGALALDDTGLKINRRLCNNCGRCVEVCNPQALKMLGKEMSVDDVFQQVYKDVQYYQISDGGITASGGEPLSQPAFVAALFEKCQQNGVHTCLETSGYGPSEALEKILPYTSLVLFDIKHINSSIHKKLAGKGNEPILRNLELVIKEKKPIIIRTPIIPGYNDSEADITLIAKTMLEMESLRKIQLMPYHKYGIGKYGMLDRQYHLNELTVPSDQKLQEIQNIFESFSIECEVKKEN